MAQLIQRLLAGVILSAVVTGGTAAYVEAQPGGVYATQFPGLAAFAEQLPDDTHFYRAVTRVSYNTVMGMADGEPAESEALSESVGVQAYDGSGNLVGSFSPGAEAPTYSIHEYDENGNRVHSVRYHDGEPMLEIFLVYDADGREISRETWISGALSSTVAFVYTPQPDGTTLLEATSCDETGEVEIAEVDRQTLDSKGRVVAAETYLNGSVELWMQAAYEYDDRDRLTRSVVTSSDGIPDGNIFIYTDAPDGSYTCTAEFTDDGVLTSRTEQQFDALGVCIHQAEYSPDGELAYEMLAEPLDM